MENKHSLFMPNYQDTGLIQTSVFDVLLVTLVHFDNSDANPLSACKNSTIKSTVHNFGMLIADFQCVNHLVRTLYFSTNTEQYQYDQVVMYLLSTTKYASFEILPWRTNTYGKP